MARISGETPQATGETPNQSIRDRAKKTGLVIDFTNDPEVAEALKEWKAAEETIRKLAKDAKDGSVKVEEIDEDEFEEMFGGALGPIKNVNNKEPKTELPVKVNRSVGFAEGDDGRNKYIEKVKDKSDDKKGFKKFKRTCAAGAVVAVIGLAVLAAKNNVFADFFNGPKTETTTGGEEDHQIKNAAIAEIVKDAESGIKNGYNSTGMFCDKDPKRCNPEDFADARKVVGLFNGDIRAATVHTAREQADSFADYLALLPRQLQPEGFEGCTIKQARDKIESMKDDKKAYAETFKHLGQVMDKALVRDVVLNGDYFNAFMQQKDPNGEYIHENMEVVQCTTTEKGIPATEFYWLDDEGNEIGSMIVKVGYDANGEIIGCIQGVTEANGETTFYIYDGLKATEPKELVGEGNPEPTKGGIDHVPTSGLTPGTPTPWGKTGDTHAEDEKNKVKYEGLVAPDSEVSEEKNANTNIGNEGKSKIAPGVASSDTTKYGDVVTIYDDDSAVTRIKGGEKQDTKPNGDNTEAPDGDPIIDEGGNYGQEKAQKEKDIKPGGNNHKDEAEIVERGGA